MRNKSLAKVEMLLVAVVALLAAAAGVGCGGDQNLHAGVGGAGGNQGQGGNPGVGGMYGVGGNPGVAGAPGIGGQPGFGGLPGNQGTGGGNFGQGGRQGIGGSGTGGAPGIGGSGIGGAPGVGGSGIGGAPGVGGNPGTGGAPASCALASQSACDANPFCHSVFFDPDNCACSGAGCCAAFHHCAEGGDAQCYGGVSCAVATPFCEGPYVVAYANGCYEGCVNQTDCGFVCTPGADQSCNDNPIVSAIHGHCTDAGTCQCRTGFILNPNTGRCL